LGSFASVAESGFVLYQSNFYFFRKKIFSLLPFFPESQTGSSIVMRAAAVSGSKTLQNNGRARRTLTKSFRHLLGCTNWQGAGEW
jgi:hypothetical protein